MNFLKNNKGDVSAVNFILIMFTCITIISYLGGFYDVVAKRHALTKCVNHVARVAGRQGGFQSSKPEDWDQDFRYLTSSDVREYVRSAMSVAAIEDWDLNINGLNFSSNTNFNFKTDIDVKMTMHYNWGMFLPASARARAEGAKSYTISRTVTSEKFLRHFKDVEYDNS